MCLSAAKKSDWRGEELLFLKLFFGVKKGWKILLASVRRKLKRMTFFRWLQKELYGLEEDFGVVAGGVVDDAEKVGFVDGFRIWAVAKIRFDGAFQFFHFVDGISLR